MPGRQALMFTDEGEGRDPDRPRFRGFVQTLRDTHANESGPPIAFVSELTRLFRNRADRQIIDGLIETGRIDVATAREDIDTSTPDGRARYAAMADLIILAYEGTALPAGARSELVDRYVTDILGAWLDLVAAPSPAQASALADVRSRLRALARIWDTSDCRTLLAPFSELALNHDPSELPVEIRELALVGVRNSELENLHVGDEHPIKDYDWRVITQAAAYALHSLPTLPAGDLTDADDPFAGVVDGFPTAAAAFAVLSRLGLGEEAKWSPPDRATPELALETFDAEMTEEGYDVVHAMDERLSNRFERLLESCGDPDFALCFPSLKHISRNPRKLFAVVDYALAHHTPIVTSNVLLDPQVIQRRDTFAPYNKLDIEWSGMNGGLVLDQPDAEQIPVVGRNDPCPFGSGLKYKRCHGR